MRARARHYLTGETIEITCEDGGIKSISPPTGDPVDLEAGWIAPAFFDLQINGCLGYGFHSESLTSDILPQIVLECQRHGVAAFCPTLITNSYEALSRGFHLLNQACESDSEIARALPGFHLEGPYLSAEDGPRGAHPQQFVRPPDWNEFQRLQESAGGRIRLLTLAPEWDNALEFIEKATEAGIVIAIGHTAASGDRICEAVKVGAKLSTHLGNGSHATLPRHHNYLWEQLACDELWASLICDGHHLPAAVAKSLIRGKTPARTVLTCDASPLAGLPPGRYVEWGQDLEVLPTGRVVLADTPYLAGSGAFTETCVAFALKHCDVDLPSAIDMAGAHPRKLLNFPDQPMEEGQPADLILFEHEEGGDFQLKATLIAGQRIHE